MHAEENTDPADLATLEAVRVALVETFEAGFVVVCREEGGKTVWSKVEFGNAFALGKLAEDYAGGLPGDRRGTRRRGCGSRG
jgi:hypothetical protein